MKRIAYGLATALGLALPLHADPFWGAMEGGFEGAIIGGILGGEEGAIDGALIGGTIGAIDGADRQYQRDRSYYRDRYIYTAPPPRQRQYQRQPSSSANLVFEVQLALRRLGYNPGPADGIAGQGTARAVAQYKRDHGLPQDNVINSSLLAHMRRNGG